MNNDAFGQPALGSPSWLSYTRTKAISKTSFHHRLTPLRCLRLPCLSRFGFERCLFSSQFFSFSLYHQLSSSVAYFRMVLSLVVWYRLERSFTALRPVASPICAVLLRVLFWLAGPFYFFFASEPSYICAFLCVYTAGICAGSVGNGYV